jgi:hypothetical protein
MKKVMIEVPELLAASVKKMIADYEADKSPVNYLHYYLSLQGIKANRIGQVPEFETMVDIEKTDIGVIRYFGNDGTRKYISFIPTGSKEAKCYEIL